MIERIRQEMEKVGFDEIRIDPMGNILGRIGSGKTVIMMDSHTDTVGVGDPKEWAWDPYQGKVEDGYIYGRGACDQRAGMASMVYAGKLIKELGLAGDYTLWVVGSVQEEDCDGLCVALHPEGRRHPPGLRGDHRAQQPAASIAGIAGAWRSKSTCAAGRATPARRSAATIRFTR